MVKYILKTMYKLGKKEFICIETITKDIEICIICNWLSA